MEAKELFDICNELAQSGPSTIGLHRMHQVLMLCCSEGTRQHKGSFGNLFAQVDYLCKQHALSTSDRVALQTLRRHARQNPDEPLPGDEDWRYDLRALAGFISTIFKTDMPGELRRRIPPTNRELNKNLHVDRRYVRCIVRKWDAKTLTADTEEGELTVDYGSTDGGRDLSYLTKLLREGMQLNLLDSHLRATDGALVPRFIIVEPDFLVDISTIAACFTNYGHHPLLYTLNRLKERPNTQAILLGNFAGTALDMIVNEGESRNASASVLKASLRRSFREQALRFCACADFNAAKFKNDAAQQVSNLEETVEELFTTEGFDRQKALLEPSFVCERLGLQGRVDLMTNDLRLLVEQKSGKNMKIELNSHDPHGKQREDHYVQLLLYYGILRYNFERTDKSVDIRLLYSRYPTAQGLLTVNYYRQLFADALQQRNQIVATELFIAREGFGRIIPLLHPSIIYKGVKPDSYFNQYVLPDVQAFSQLLASISPLERAYYERMMTFVYREQVCQKLGTADQWLQHNSGAACDLWQMPLAQKTETGNIIMDLSIVRQQKTDDNSGYDRITLCGPAVPTLNFRRGDMVYLYAYREAPDVRLSILYKGTLEALTGETFTVRLTNGQQNPDIFTVRHAQHWAIEHAGSDASTSGNLRALQQFIAAQPDRKDLLLAQREPKADLTLRLTQSYSSTYDHLLEKAKQARDYFLLVGPPGTGKTSQALRYMVAEELNSTPTDNRRQPSLLLTAYTNRAVDEICTMLDGEGFDYLRLGNEASCDERFRRRLLETSLEEDLRLDEIQQRIEQTPIIVSTTSMLQARPYIFQLKHFTCCIVDEASQILEPGLIGILASSHIDRFVLIGDYKQLPAVVVQDEAMSRVEEPCLRDIGLCDCRQSLFERLIRWEQHCGRTQFIGTLDHQGRMHPDVAQFPSSHFYADEQLLPVPLSHQQETTLDYHVAAEDDLDQALQHHRVLFLPCHDNEAALVASLLLRIHRFYGTRFDPEKTVGVIVPYRHQIGLIRHELEGSGLPDLLRISIDTVERYQGSQRDVIVYSFAVTHSYQLDFLTANTFTENDRPIDRKLNVAMTRARKQLIMTGRAELLRHVPLFSEIIAQYSLGHPF